LRDVERKSKKEQKKRMRSKEREKGRGKTRELRAREKNAPEKVRGKTRARGTGPPRQDRGAAAGATARCSSAAVRLQQTELPGHRGSGAGRARGTAGPGHSPAAYLLLREASRCGSCGSVPRGSPRSSGHLSERRRLRARTGLQELRARRARGTEPVPARPACAPRCEL
jgi:hypothetical protein